YLLYIYNIKDIKMYNVKHIIYLFLLQILVLKSSSSIIVKKKIKSSYTSFTCPCFINRKILALKCPLLDDTAIPTLFALNEISIGFRLLLRNAINFSIKFGVNI